MERDAVLVYRLEERLRALSEDVSELRVDVDGLLRKREREEAISEKVARDATAHLRGRELAIAAAALVLTTVNVVVSVWK